MDMAALQSVAGQVLFSGTYGISDGVQNTNYTGWGWHNDVYNDTQTALASIDVRNADGIVFHKDQFQHLSSGIALSFTSDVIKSSATGNAFVDISGNAVNVGNAQNAYPNATNIYSVASRLFPSGVWGVCTDDTIQDNLIRLPNREYYTDNTQPSNHFPNEIADGKSTTTAPASLSASQSGPDRKPSGK
jgi:hypothetical protein